MQGAMRPRGARSEPAPSATGRIRAGHGGRARGVPRPREEAGQASIELLGALPLLLVLGLVLFQLLAVGYASVLAGSAAEAGALALAGGGDPEAGVRKALPGWSRVHARVSVTGGTVRLRLRPPSLLAALARRLEVNAQASVER